MRATPDLLPAPPVVRLLAGRELTAHRRTFLAWAAPVALLLVMVASLQPSMAGDGGVLAAKLEAMPEGLRRALGMTAVDLARPASYLSINFVYVTLTASLLAATLGATMLAKEESLRTAELLYAQPVDRRRVVAGKAAAALAYVLAFNALLAVVAIGALAAFVAAPVEPALIAQMFVGTTALGVCFTGVGLLVAAVAPRPRLAGGIALGITLGAYLLAVAAAAAPGGARIGELSPFRHVEPSTIVARGGVDPIAVIALVAVGVACGAAAIARYARRDLAA